jgi:hypothetical protein
MKIPAIRKLVETTTPELLEATEAAILEGAKPPMEVEGADEGEQLTHVMAAIWVLKEMKKTGVDFRTAMRQYTEKVRNSIS